MYKLYEIIDMFKCIDFIFIIYKIKYYGSCKLL
uniref:Uncharacterized protein n=1 Tax=viral metagenome TaxID=1070528 RepID=A0A6C0I5W7_9ZZZZ